MRQLPLVFSALLLFGLAALHAEETALGNQDIIDLINAGLGEELIARKIASSESMFDMSPQAMIKLKNAKVPDELIDLMLAESVKSHKKVMSRINIECQNYAVGNPELQKSALLFLRRSRSLALPRLREMLSDSMPSMRAGACQALAALGDQEATPIIAELLRDQEQSARFAAAAALALLRDEKALKLAQKGVAAAPAPVDGYIRLLGLRQDPAALGFIGTRLLKDNNAATREQAAWALGEIGLAAGVAPLEEALLHDQTLEVVVACAAALGKLAPPSGFAKLVKICRSNPKARAATLAAIGQYPAKQSVPFLIDAVAQQLTPAEEAAALSALRRLTNRNYGVNTALWQEWLKQNKANLSEE